MTLVCLQPHNFVPPLHNCYLSNGTKLTVFGRHFMLRHGRKKHQACNVNCNTLRTYIDCTHHYKLHTPTVHITKNCTHQLYTSLQTAQTNCTRHYKLHTPTVNITTNCTHQLYTSPQTAHTNCTHHYKLHAPTVHITTKCTHQLYTSIQTLKLF